MTTSLETRTAFNGGLFGVIDRHGEPFTPGARVRFRKSEGSVNLVEGAGVIQGFDLYGGATILADREFAIRDRNGVAQRYSRTVYVAFANFDQATKLRRTAGKVGDPHETGAFEIFIELEKEST